jgi:transcriptional regulator with XRE-family HTH domain|tara:strand:+ start:1209 stop:1430 length:222 start_codon:yes stop_codon:yes gene_type:complete
MELYDRQAKWSDTVRQLRKDTGITITELGRRSGISRCHLSYIENNKREPTIRTMELILKSLGHNLEIISTEYL